MVGTLVQYRQRQVIFCLHLGWIRYTRVLAPYAIECGPIILFQLHLFSMLNKWARQMTKIILLKRIKQWRKTLKIWIEINWIKWWGLCKFTAPHHEHRNKNPHKTWFLFALHYLYFFQLSNWITLIIRRPILKCRYPTGTTYSIRCTRGVKTPTPSSDCDASLWTPANYRKSDPQSQQTGLPCRGWRICPQFHRTSLFPVLWCNRIEYQRHGQNLQVQPSTWNDHQSWTWWLGSLPFGPWEQSRIQTCSLCPIICRLCLGSLWPRFGRQGAKRRKRSSPSDLSGSQLSVDSSNQNHSK